MKSFHIKSIILGIGIGVILTSIIGIIFTAGFIPNKVQLSNEQIIEKAKMLGMLEAKSILEEANPGDAKLESEGTNTGASPKNNNIISQTASTLIQKPTPTPIPKKVETEILLEVVKGDTSERVADRLMNANLIPEKKQFIDELTRQGLTMEINIGKYKIKQGTDIKEIIKVITSTK